MDFPLKVLLLFHKSNGTLELFYQELAEINANSTFNIILDDFNVNAVEPNSQISQLLSDYVQIVSEHIQISGSFLDHVYVQKTFLDSTDIKSYVNTIHISDHDAIQLTLFKKDALV